MHPKSFYNTYLASDERYPIDDVLVLTVLAEKPQSVFDFGTGTGKNLKPIWDAGVSVCGLDLSLLNITYARARNDLPYLIVGDEYFLCRLRNFDVGMTCSVLCHIENIDDIIKELKLMCAKSIIIAETNDVAGEYYYPHDYESYGFKEGGYTWHSPINNAEYKIWKFTR